MSRLFVRRERILPGPLKLLQQVERRSPVPVTPLALASAAITAGLLLMLQLSPSLSVDPTPMVAYADAVPEPAAFVAAAPVEAVLPAQEAAPARLAAADPSPFQLDLLPVLEADGTDLDIGPTPAVTPTGTVPKAATRRVPVSPRGAGVVAAGGPAQP